MAAKTLLAAIKTVRKVNDREVLLDYLDTIIDLVRDLAHASYPAEQMAAELQYLRSEYTPARSTGRTFSSSSDRSGPEEVFHDHQFQQQARNPLQAGREQPTAVMTKDLTTTSAAAVATTHINRKACEGDPTTSAGIRRVSVASAGPFDPDAPLNPSLDLPGTWSDPDCFPELNRHNASGKTWPLWNDLISSGADFDPIQSDFMEHESRAYRDVFDSATTEARSLWGVTSSVFSQIPNCAV